MAYRIELDFVWNCTLEDFLKPIEAHSGRIAKFVTNGPGGGNPCVALEFDTREALEGFVRGYSQDEDDFEFHLTLAEEA